jgi:hypothetical protein
MVNKTKIALFSGAALMVFAIATPASAAPGGSYRQSCRDIEQRYGQMITAECQARDGSWVQTRLDADNCNADIANINGRLVCTDDERQADRSVRIHQGDYGYGNRDDNDDQADDNYKQSYGDNGRSYDPAYGDRRTDDRDYGDDVMPRRAMIRNMERQGYSNVHDLRRIRSDNDWSAMATWRGRSVIVRLNAHTGRVLAARYI